MKILRYQFASNILEDALSVELIDETGAEIADICRYDGRNELKLNTFNNDIDLEVLQAFIEVARRELGAFEDGTPLSNAQQTQTLLID